MTSPPHGHFELWPPRDGIAWVYFKTPGGTPSPVDLVALRSLDAVLEELERRARTGEIQAVLIAAGTVDHSLSAYSPAELVDLDPEGVIAWSHEAQGVLSRLEELPAPTIAVVQGPWSGGGAELALACRYRVAASDSQSRLAFTQIAAGLPPAWGGTVRLSRIVGVPVAARLILTGEPLEPAEAKDLGLIDRKLPGGEFEEAVERFARRRIIRGPQTGGRERKPIRARLLDETGPGRRLIARRIVRRYRAAARADAAAEAAVGLLLNVSSMAAQRALAKESAAAGRVIGDPTTRARLHANAALDRVRRLPDGTAGSVSAAVIGAGQTGSDLSHLLITAGIPVRLKDTPDTVRSGLAQARLRIRWEQNQGRISSAQARRRADRLDGVTGFGGFGTLDLLIAAADGTAADPTDLLRGAEPHVLPSCVLACHDWTRSPNAVQRELRYPERMLGLVCQFPADTFPLVEVVPGAATSPSTVDRVVAILGAAGLTPIIVPEDTPTPGMRFLGIYLAEACRLLAEGATTFQVDEAMEAFGFRVGPFHRIDAIGSVRTHRILSSLAASLGERFTPTAFLDRIARSADTFYRYRNGVPVAPHPGLPAGLSPGGPTVTGMIQRRMLLLLVNEAARILETHPRAEESTLDAISLVGLGFPRERGGLVYYAERLGPPAIVEDLDRIARRAGPRYKPADILREAAVAGRPNLRPESDPEERPRNSGTGGGPEDGGSHDGIASREKVVGDPVAGEEDGGARAPNREEKRGDQRVRPGEDSDPPSGADTPPEAGQRRPNALT